MACAMETDFLRYATFLYHLAHPFTDRPIIEVRKYKVVFLERLVAFDYLQGNVQQLYLERHTRLVSLGDNPFLSVYLHNLLSSLMSTNDKAVKLAKTKISRR